MSPRSKKILLVALLVSLPAIAWAASRAVNGGTPGCCAPGSDCPPCPACP